MARTALGSKRNLIKNRSSEKGKMLISDGGDTKFSQQPNSEAIGGRGQPSSDVNSKKRARYYFLSRNSLPP